MFLVNMAGITSKYKRMVDSLEIYAVIEWHYRDFCKSSRIVTPYLCYNGRCYNGTTCKGTPFFFGYNPTERQKKLIGAFLRRVAKVERVGLL